MQNIYNSILLFFISYITVTIIGILHTIFNIYVLKMDAMNDKGMGSGYEKTKPYHPLYNIIIFSIFAYLYISELNDPTFKEAIITGIMWCLICIVFDIFAWVIIKHPFSLSFREFYINYQPFISLIYLAIFLSPIIAYFIYIF